ncbi:MAG: sugar transferase [Deltaproteobacteria bacterium]|nr:sugar transferase [Deltaproteobacteria bacterium]
MTSRRAFLLVVLELADLFVICASFVVAVAATMEEPHVEGWLPILEMRVKLQNLFFLLAYLGFCHLALRSRGLYRSHRLSSPSQLLSDLAAGVLIAICPLVLLGPLLHFQFVTNLFLAGFTAMAFIGLSLERTVVREVARRIRRRGRNLRDIIIIGAGDDACDLMAKLAHHQDLGYHVVEVIETSPALAGNGAGKGGNGATGSGAGQPVDPVIARVEALLARGPIDEIFVALPLDTSQPLVARLLSICDEEGITVRVMAHLASLYWARAVPDELEGQPVLTIYTGPQESLALLVKRSIDIVVALVTLLAFAPMFALVALAIRLESGGPVFFAQERVGLNRRRFRAYKFRTMVVDAESMQAQLESLNEAEGPVFKIKNDPRITGLGRWLRRLSIDELPQLINVVRGEMSLVGPRPLPVRDVSRIDVRWHKRRFSVKPGITCLWQVNGRRPQFDEWARLDMQYIDNWSLGLDFKILLKTIPAVLSRQGAH